MGHDKPANPERVLKAEPAWPVDPNWVLEPELAQPLPRRVRWTWGMHLGRLLAAGLLLGAFGAAWYLFPDAARLEQLSAEGMETDGTIHSVGVPQPATNRGTVAYSWTVNGQTFSGSRSMPVRIEFIRRPAKPFTLVESVYVPAVGDPIRIRYLPDDPSFGVPPELIDGEAREKRGNKGGVLGIVFLFVFVCGIAYVRAEIGARRVRRLVRWGTALPGTPHELPGGPPVEIDGVPLCVFHPDKQFTVLVDTDEPVKRVALYAHTRSIVRCIPPRT